MYRILITLSLIYQFNGVFSQPLIGLWKGHSKHTLSILNTTSESLEIINQNDDSLSGIVHYYYSEDKFEHIKFNGKINWKDSTLKLYEVKEIGSNFDSSAPKICLGIITLKLSKNETGYLLQGKWRDKNRKLFNCPDLKVKYEMAIAESIINSSSNQKSNELLRITDVQNLIEIRQDERDSIIISVYDNGEIDNDTVTLYYNNNVIFKSIRLTQNPYTYIINIDSSKKINRLLLVAENLGSIPPNTALAVITTRFKKYVVNLSGDYSKNASIEFYLKD